MKARVKALYAALVAEAETLWAGIKFFKETPGESRKDAAFLGWMPLWVGYFTGYVHGHEAAHRKLKPELAKLAKLERQAQEERIRHREICQEVDRITYLMADRLGLPASEQLEKLKRLCQNPGSGEDA